LKKHAQQRAVASGVHAGLHYNKSTPLASALRFKSL